MGILLKVLVIIILGLFYKNPPEFQEYTKVYSNGDCLTANIFFEAKGESIKGKKAVAAVTYNRLYKSTRESTYRNKNICSVVYEPKQFSWTHQQQPESVRKILEGDIGHLNKKDRQAYLDARKIAQMPVKEVLEGVPKGVLFYHSVKVKPKWANKFKIYKRINNHIFYTYQKD